jgi:SAM-dependent methyltransferase
MFEERTRSGLHATLLPIVQSLGLTPDARILDVACGTGAWLSRLHGVRFVDLWGIDRDADNFQAHDAAHFIAADLDRESPFPANLALVTMIEIIEHVKNPYRLIRMAENALVPGGWLLISSPNIYSLRARLRFLIRPRLPHFERSRAPIDEDHIHPVVLEAYKRKIFDPLKFDIVRVWTHPEGANTESRFVARLVAKAIGLVLPEDLPGDTLCLLLRKQLIRGDRFNPRQPVR